MAECANPEIFKSALELWLVYLIDLCDDKWTHILRV